MLEIAVFITVFLRFFNIFELFSFFHNSPSLYIVEPGPKYLPTQGDVWPEPQFEHKQDIYYEFRLSVFHVLVTQHHCDILTNALYRYNLAWKRLQTIMKSNRIPSRRRSRSRLNITRNADYRGLIKELRVELTAPCEDYPHFDMDESYKLTVAETSVLKSKSIWGIIRGLETWTQLFYITDNFNSIQINATQIHDYPQYKHRGLLLDTGRHFVSLSNILKTLDAMAMNKMNVFHWHIVDDQSFPYQSEKFPDLSGMGAFHPTMVYTKADIKRVVDYARDRAIRVVPEIDVPGHTRSWGAAYPSILTECYKDNEVVALGPMNPIENNTYKLLRDILAEVQEWFPDKYLHVGGDEVDLNCWKSNPDLQAYMIIKGITAAQLHALFMKNVIPLLGNKSIPVVWQEVFDEKVPISQETLVQVWKYEWIEEMVKILSAGHRVVFSSSWYLDYLQFSWESFYSADPRVMVYEADADANLENIVGGEACMWGEMADDSNIISRTWPRASAVAERLWTGVNYKNAPSDLVTDQTRRRIEEHACRMKQRGVNAEPPNGPGFCVAVA